ADHPQADEVDLLVAEVGANAYRHTLSGRPGGSLRACVFGACERLRVEITDDGGASGPPVPRDDPEGECGRGLWLMEQLADTCGFWQDDLGRTSVFFELTR
ncbi:MAG TPA: ATP-binding protein, partial [Streptosporangiaceae bacterium]|nr:ATP-binding protein [Streptosporangiaceae bacterium]